MPKDLVRDATGVPVLCSWDDCGQYGDDRVKEIVPEGQKRVHYVFCSEGHRDFWRNSIRNYGNHSSGNRGGGGLIVNGAK